MEKLSEIFIIQFLNKLIISFLGIFCHQEPSLSVNLNNMPLPICYRCLGLHGSFFIVSLILKLFPNYYFLKIKVIYRYVFISATCITGLHWFLGLSGFMEMNSGMRFITGLISGTGFRLLISSLVWNKTSGFVRSEPLFKKTIGAGSFVIVVSVVSSMNYNLILFLLTGIMIYNILIVLRNLKYFLATKKPDNQYLQSITEV